MLQNRQLHWPLHVPVSELLNSDISDISDTRNEPDFFDISNFFDMTDPFLVNR